MQQLQRALLKIKLLQLNLLWIFCISCSVANSQTEFINSPYLISSSGGTLTQDNYNLCFSIGEIAIETFTQPEIILTQGFHQDNYQFSSIEELLYEHEIKLYPNPTQDILYVDCKIEELVDLMIKDTKGSIIFSLIQADGSKKQEIYLNHFSQGVYFLEVGLGQNKKQVYKIQKLN